MEVRGAQGRCVQWRGVKYRGRRGQCAPPPGTSRTLGHLALARPDRQASGMAGFQDRKVVSN
eukprot:scaffold52095_cov41-Tisochrysis_lutea.AAC.1